MANLTLSVDEDLLRRARIQALEEGTSVNALVRDYLTRYAGEPPGARALARFVDTARSAQAGSGGRGWSREELHDRAALR